MELSSELWGYRRETCIIKRPPNSGSKFYNYKGTYSNVLFAVVEANYYFSYIDVGCNGKANDSSVFRNRTFNIALERNMLHFPYNGVREGDDYSLVRKNLLKPFSGYRLKL
jgi:hypothetical protein